MYIDIHPKLVVDVTTWAARHSISVEAVVREGLRTYMEDVDLGLLPVPQEEPRYQMRLRRHRDDVG